MKLSFHTTMKHLKKEIRQKAMLLSWVYQAFFVQNLANRSSMSFIPFHGMVIFQSTSSAKAMDVA